MNTHYLTSFPEEWQPIARIFAALGDETRQTILLLFEPGEELGLKDLVYALPLSRTAVVHHLDVLEQAGLVVAQKRGREVWYSLNLKRLIEALDDVKTYAEGELSAAAAVGRG